MAVREIELPRAQSWACLRAPDGCACQCHAIARGRRNGKKVLPASVWTQRETLTLLSMFRSGETAEMVAKTITEKYGRPRSRRAVLGKAIALGVTFRQGWYSGKDIRSGLGVHQRRMTRWIESGTLPATRHIGVIRGTQSRWWHVEDVDLMTFIDQYAGVLFSAKTVKNPHWRSRAEVAARVNTRRRPDVRPV